MAVTGAIFKTLTFNGESSKNYGVYITGSGAYDAPKRDVEMVTIAGRNGSFPLDHGRFENIEVRYPAGIFGDDEQDFADAISDFRNMLCSAKGYCRLEDDYNPDEYRLAIYKSGLEVEPSLLKAGEFEIVFECKPQRFLKSGETPVTIGASTTVANPTRFESSPEVRVKGYGTVAFNGYQIDIANQTYGEVTVFEKATASYGHDYTLYNIDEYANNGDQITMVINPSITVNTRTASTLFGTPSLVSATLNGTPYYNKVDDRHITFGFENSTFLFAKHTDDGDSVVVVYDVPVKRNGSVLETVRISLTFAGYYAASGELVGVNRYITITQSQTYVGASGNDRVGILVTVDGTKSMLGNPTIIDCDLGEAYKETADGIVSLDAYIDLGTDLPTLASGNNTVTKTNTITECKIVPRWWKV